MKVLKGMDRNLDSMLTLHEVHNIAPHTPGLLQLLQGAAESLANAPGNPQVMIHVSGRETVCKDLTAINRRYSACYYFKAWCQLSILDL